MSHASSSPRSPRPKPANQTPGVSLSPEHISGAQQKSTDNGATLDLSHKNIRQISEEVAHELVALGHTNPNEDAFGPVSRLALGFNRLATLPTAFTLLAHVRYLNLKGNAFTSFPDPVTTMPALEVLDLSRNKIRSLPKQPGSLSNLRVFSLSKNKISVLPIYITQFRSLRILKVDQNPFEYPPISVMVPTGDLKDHKFMESWIESVKQWLREESSPARRSSMDSTASEQKLEFRSPILQSSVSFLTADEKFHSFDLTTHSRTTSVDSDNSAYSAIEASPQMSFLPSNGLVARGSGLGRPPRLNLSPVPSFIPTATHTESPTSPAHYLPTPDGSVSSEEDTAKIFGVNQPQQHARNASYAAGSKLPRPSLAAKKSLPDMRLAMPESTSITPALPLSTGAPLLAKTTVPPRDLPSRSPSRQDSGFSEGRSDSVRTSTDTVVMPPPIADRPPSVTSIDVERNSYFRRLSTLPPSTICKSVPRSLLTLVDAARGILFAVSQVYQSLQHYTVYAIDERLSAVLLKVLDPASHYMLSLINALDRFDATSRRSVPSPSVCRAVVESCRDTVSIFIKAMGVLSLQLKVLATGDDIRYTRQLLLVLYGATAEVSNSWQSIFPYMEEVEPLLRERPPPSSSKLPPHQATPTSRSVSPHIPFGSPASHPPSSFMPSPRLILRSHSAQPPGVESERSRMMRRHAGSFSSKDVEIGKMLPSYMDPLPITPRIPRNTSNLSINPGISGYRRSWGEHSRQNSQSSMVASSSSSTASSPSIPSKHHMQDPPSSSSTLLDNEAVEAMKVAVDIAPSVWETMETLVGDVVSAKFNISEALASAKVLTKRLRDNIKAVREFDPTADRKALRDDATVFAKTVILLCNVFKNHGAERPLPSDLRTNMIVLMNATEESVMLLHVSSFSPSTNRPYSPLISGGSGFGLSTPGFGASSSPSLTTGGSGDDMREFKLGSGITTTRHALQSNTARPGLYNSGAAGLRGQAPHQGFKVPSFTRVDSKGRYGGLTSGDES